MQRWLDIIRLRFRSLVRRSDAEGQLDKELRFHLEQQIEENIALGMPPAEARFAALRSLGGITQIQEECRDMRRTNYIEDLWQDLQYALRTLMKTPGFTLTAVLTLALGIGATTAIFTLVHEVMLKSLPVANPDQLYRVGDKVHCCIWGGYSQDGEFSLFSYELYKHFRDNTDGFEEMAAFGADVTWLSVRRNGSAHAADAFFGKFVSGNYFSMFGIGAFVGRPLTKADDQAGAVPVAMMSYRAWQQKYSLDPAVVGSGFTMNGKPFTIVGVAPPGFYGDTLQSNPPDFWIPLSREPAVHGNSSLLEQADANWLDIIGRVPKGANTAAIEAKLKVELRQWLTSHIGDMSPDDRRDLPRQSVHLSPGGAGVTSMREAYEHGLRLLMMVSSFVLLIACANIANLTLVRGMARRQQVSMRMALGAPQFRLIRQALTESLVLALAGGVAGVAVAYAGTQAILHLAFEGANYVPIHATPSYSVLLFALGVSLTTAMLFGIAPAWATSHSDPVEALRGANRSTKASSTPQKTLVILQAALSLVLLSAAGLLTRSLNNLQHMQQGFKTENRQIVRFDPVLAGYKPEQMELLFRRLLDKLIQVPGVIRVSYSMYSPMSGDNWNVGVLLEGKPPIDDRNSMWERIGPDYFDTIGTRLVRGRSFTERDTQNSPHVAVVNEAFVRHFFKNTDPLGKRFGHSDAKHSSDYEIVGVAEDARYLSYDLDKPVRPMFFVPLLQLTQYEQPFEISTESRSRLLHEVQLQITGRGPSIEAQVRRAFEEIDPNLTVIRLMSFADQVSQNFTQEQLIARLTSLFGILALVLASIGLYGVTAYTVERRTSEIGIRMALGADRRSVLAMVLRGAFLMTGVGLVLGIPLSFAAGRLLSSQLYGINGFDPLTLASAVLVLGLCAFVAGVLPARRASSIQPIEALRVE
jgi:predicted permease